MGRAGIWKGVFVILLLALFFSASRSFAAGEVNAPFDAANKLYAQNKFVEAVAAYEQVLTNGTISPVLYFNLGNAYFKAGQIGSAIAAYRQAEQLTPRDPDLRANLRFAQNRVTGPTLKTSAWQRGLGTLSLREWTWVAVAGFWITFGLLIARQLKPALAARLKMWTWLSAAVSVVLFVLVGLAWSQQRAGRVLIITATEVTVRNSPFDEAPSSFTANDGAELRVLDQKDDWLQVTDDANRFGWVKRSATSWTPRS
jgi:tetratricopeptide (TPR) repeat protein